MYMRWPKALLHHLPSGSQDGSKPLPTVRMADTGPRDERSWSGAGALRDRYPKSVHRYAFIWHALGY